MRIRALPPFSAECDDSAEPNHKRGTGMTVKQKVRGIKPRTATYIAHAATQSQYLPNKDNTVKRACTVARLSVLYLLEIYSVRDYVADLS